MSQDTVKLNFRFNFDRQYSECTADFTIGRNSQHFGTTILLLLNPEMEIESVSVDGSRHEFAEELISPLEEKKLRLKQIQIRNISNDKEQIRLSIRYCGRLDGFEAFCPYVHDRIAREFTIVRFESFLFPFLMSSISSKSFFEVFNSYEMRYTVSIDLTNDLDLHSGFDVLATQLNNGTTHYVIDTKRPVHSIHFVIGLYETINSSLLSLHVQKRGKQQYRDLLRNVNKCIDFLSTKYGSPIGSNKLEIIEIPDGYGSFAGDGFVYQESKSITDEKFLQHIFHELVHTSWNPQARGKIQRTRFFDEAFAQYLSARVVRQFYGLDKYYDLINRWLISVKRRLEDDQDASETPISEYWKKEIGDLSYIKGPIFLHLVEKLAGTETFDSFLKDYICRHRNDILPTFNSFRSETEATCGANVGRLFDEWIYGTESSVLINRVKDVLELEKEYA